MPMRGELPIAPVPVRSRESAIDDLEALIVTTIKRPVFQMLVLFCAIGLWLAFCLAPSFPDLGQIAAALEQMS